jgi:hypothetical protein
VPAQEGREPGAGADLEERHAGLGAQRLDPVREAHRQAQMPRPVAGIGRLFGADPGAGAARQEGDLRGLGPRRRDPRLERRHGRLDLRRVAGEGDLERQGHDPLRGEPAGELRHRRRRAGDAHQGGRVERRQVNLAAEEGGDLRLGERHRQHGARAASAASIAGIADLLDQAPALGHQGQGLLEGEDAGDDGRRVLAEAVAEHRLGPHAPRAEEAGEGDLDEEQGRLGDGGAGHLPRRLLLLPGGRIEDVAQVEPQAGQQEGRGAVDLIAEERLGQVEVAAHPDVLRPLTGEDEGHRPARLRPALGRPRPGQQAHRVPRLEAGRGVPGIAADQGLADAELPAADGQGVGGVAEVAPGTVGEVSRHPRARRRQGFRGAGREGEELPGASGDVGRGRGRRGRLLEDDVGVGAAQPEGVHPGPPRRPGPAGGPGGERGVDVDRRGGEVDPRVRPLEVEAGRQLAVLQGEHGLDQPGDAGRHVQVADVALHRADGAEAPAVGVLAEGPGHRLDLDRIAQRRAGAVGLDVGDRRRIDPGDAQGLADHRRLPLDPRGREADLQAAVVVDRRPQDDGADRVAVGQRVLQPLQHDEPHPGAEDAPLGRGVEGPAVPVRRHHRSRHVAVAEAGVGLDRDAAGERQVALLVEQRLAGGVDGDQRGRAGALQAVARPGQVELVGDPGDQRVRGVAEDHLQRIGARGQRVADQVEEQVGREGGAGVDPDPGGDALGVVAGALERLPGALEEDPVLRIHELRLARVDAEEELVEAVVALHLGDRPHPVWIGEPGGIEPARRHLRGIGEAHRLDPAAQVAPELRHVAGAGKAPGHPDDGDLESGRLSP